MVLQTEYFRTSSGTLKVFEIVFSFLGMLMTIIFNSYSDVYFNISHSYTILAAIALFVTVCLVIVNVFNLTDFLHPVLQYQKYFHLVLMMFILSYSSIMLYNGSSYIHLIFAGTSGVVLATAFLVDGIMGFHTANTLTSSHQQNLHSVGV